MSGSLSTANAATVRLPPTSDRHSAPVWLNSGQHGPARHGTARHNTALLNLHGKTCSFHSSRYNLTWSSWWTKAKLKKTNQKCHYVQDHHWQTLIIFVGSYIFIYFHRVCIWMVYTLVTIKKNINRGMYWNQLNYTQIIIKKVREKKHRSKHKASLLIQNTNTHSKARHVWAGLILNKGVQSANITLYKVNNMPFD